MKDTYLFSYDVLFEGKEPSNGAVDLLKNLARAGRSFLILTDRSCYSRQRLAEKLYEAGFPLFSEEVFYTSAMAAVDAIVKNYPERNYASYIGNDAMKDLLEAGGFQLGSGKPDWVFIGENRQASYQDYSDALQAVTSGATIVSVSDRAVLNDRGKQEPGPASITMMLEYASRKESLVSGWSSPVMVKKAVRYIGAKKENTVFISADLDKEISSAQNAGVDTVFVLNGKQIDLNESKVKPTFVVDTLRGLFK
ncbi:MAG: HAD hydrolase-like protein [Solobacterium sp.]|nr:HAD hydrolase-like protein [Solobacterium sp.]